MSNPYTTQQERLQPDDCDTCSSHEAELIADALDRKRAEFVSGAMSGDRAKAEAAAELLIDGDYAMVQLAETMMLLNDDVLLNDGILGTLFEAKRYRLIKHIFRARLTNLAADHFDEADVIAEMIEAGELDEAT